MKIPFAVDGTWWLPQFPNKRVQGHLAFTIEEGTVLEMYDQFPDPLMAELVKVPLHPYTPDLIVGTIEGRTACTLFNNFCTDLGPRPRFVSAYLLLGSQFQLTEDLRFRGLSFRVRHLEEWTGMTPLEPPEEKDPFVLRLRRFDSVLDPQSHFEATFKQPVPGHVAVTSHFSPLFGMARFSSEHVAQLRVSFSTTVRLNELLQFVHDCRNFFTLLVGRDAPPFSLQLYSDDLQRLNATTHHAELFYSGIGTPPSEEIHPDEMLLPMSSLKDIATVFSNWINQASELGLGANWLLGASRTKGYLETGFLACTQAVEALHRLTKRTHFVPSSEHDDLEKALLGAIPATIGKDYRQKLESAIHYANELSLRRRLRDVIGSGGAELGLKDASAFIDKVVKTRNFLIHNDPADAADAASGEDLFKLAIDLRAVVTVFLLTSVGVPRDIALRSVLRPRWTY